MQEMTPYELLGGAGVVRWLTDRFYDIMDTDPSVKSLRDMHPADLAGSREKLYMFLWPPALAHAPYAVCRG